MITTISIEYLRSNGQDVTEWFENYERLTKCVGWEDQQKGQKLPGYLRDQAVDYWDTIPSELQFNYGAIKAVMMARLVPENAAVDATKELFNSTQLEGETVDHYGRRIRKLAKRGQNVSEAHVVNCFMTGLRPSLRRC